MRSETYMQRLLRVWSRRAALVVVGFIAINAALVAVSQMPGFQDTNVVPPLTELAANGFEVSALAAPVRESRPSDEFVADTAAEPIPVAVSSAEYLVAVGMFANPERADALVVALTQAGLPAMQRSVQFGQRDAQQVVLGPFFNRSDATADLFRLQALGEDYRDARVIEE